MYNSVGARMDFETAVEMFASAYNKSPEWVKQQFRPTQSRLRLEQACSTTTTQINFPVIINQGTPFNTEVRLNLQDIFVPTHVGIRFGNPTGATDASFKMFSYLNPFVFNVAMQAYYNGTLSTLVNNVQYVNKWPVDWHYDSPETQQTAVAGAGSPVDEYNGSESGKVAMQPYVTLNGQQNIQVSINLPVAPTAVTANSRIILLYDGILFQNATVVS